MKRKILTVLLSTTIILSLLTGCTNSNNDNNTNLTTTTTSSSEDISEPTEISSEEITEEVVEGENDLVIVAIFDSAFDLGNNYVDNVVGELDHHIDAVLDYTALGEHLAENCDEYLLLDSGRIIEFEL